MGVCCFSCRSTKWGYFHFHN